MNARFPEDLFCLVTTIPAESDHIKVQAICTAKQMRPLLLFQVIPEASNYLTRAWTTQNSRHWHRYCHCDDHRQFENRFMHCSLILLRMETKQILIIKHGDLIQYCFMQKLISPSET